MGLHALQSSPDPLRLTECASCRYSLEGLPREGICPECGQSYDQQTVVLYGWAVGKKAEVSNSRPTGAAVRMVGTVAVVCWLCSSAVVWNWLTAVPVVLVAMPTLVMLAHRWAMRGAELSQVRLNAQACVQRDLDIPGSGLKTLQALSYAVGWPAAFILILGAGPAAFIVAAMVAGVVLLGALATWLLEGRRTGVAAPDQPIGWNEVTDVLIETRTDDTCRIRCRVPGSWSRPRVTVVDAIVKCSQEQADELRRRIAVWQEAATS